MLCIPHLVAQEEAPTPIYDMYLNEMEGIKTLEDLEEKFGTKIVARMHKKRKNRIVSYYKVATNDFVGFTADLSKVKLLDIPYFRSLKGLKDYLEKNPDPREALTRYYVNHPRPTINIYE